MSLHIKSGVFDPSGKPFKQRLHAFLNYALKHYKVSIGQGGDRTPEWAQRMHLCHMFLYNGYKGRPKHVDKVNKRTISWEHMSDPGVAWKLIKFTDLLRTANNTLPEKMGMLWKTGLEPDLEKSKDRMKQLLIQEGCGHEGRSMIACGISPCGEPCGCPAGKSRHIAGLAIDLNVHALSILEHRLHVHKQGNLDHLLEVHGLYRPLLHAKIPETWHIESIPPSDHIHHSKPPAHHHLRNHRLEARDMLVPCPHPPMQPVTTPSRRHI